MDKSEVLGRLVHTEHTIRSQASKKNEGHLEKYKSAV